MGILLGITSWAMLRTDPRSCRIGGGRPACRCCTSCEDHGESTADQASGLTGACSGRSFNRLTPAFWLPKFLSRPHRGSWRSKTWSTHNEQENVPAEQPSSREGARFPSAHAYACRPRDPRRSSPQGSRRAFRLSTQARSQAPVLAKANRITTGDDYKGVVRRGRRFVTPHFVTYVRSDPEAIASRGQGARFGFIVAKTVGNATQRNRVRRRLKAASYLMLDRVQPGVDVVIRALPDCSTASWETLRSELAESLTRSANSSTSRRRESSS